jgi:AraC family transcriptional regulator, transcriptional activator of the genes for pyochelin and ferripyochelin receptors
MKVINHMLDQMSLASKEHGNIICSPLDRKGIHIPTLFSDAEDDTISLQASGLFGSFQLHELKNENYCITHDHYRLLQDTSLSARADTQSLGLHYNLRSSFQWNISGFRENILRRKQYNMFYLPSFECEYLFRKEHQYMNFGVVFTEDYLQRCNEAFPFLPQFLKRVDLKIPTIVNENHISSTPRMMEVIQSILHCDYTGMLKKMYLDSKVSELLLLSLRNIPDMNEVQVTLHQSDIDLVHQAKEYLLSNLENPCSIRDLAHLVGLNEYKIKMGFKQLYKNTVFGLLQEERLQKARMLLQDTQMTIQDISLLTGYKNLSNFTAAFKRKFGFPPSSIK